MRASEERYRVLSEMLSDYACVTRVDADKSIHLEWEREGALTPLTGYSREELIEMGGPGGIILPEDRPTAVLQWSPNMPAEDAEFRIRHKDGSIRWLHRVCQGEQSQDPRVVGRLYETLRDVTERKDLEKRSLALAVEQERSRILSNFIRDASHEFARRCPSINLNVYTLKRFLTNEEHLKRLETVAQQIRAMNDLVDSLLNLSRVDSVTDLSRAPLNVNALLVLTHEPYRVHATEKALSFELVLHPSLPQISGNIDYLTIAISKLLDNAVRYTSEGQIIARTLPDHSHVVIEVQDTGLGMSPETQERIFERFFRLDDARSERGFGLGLPLAQRIVELHGGHIRVASEEGKGTTFRIYLPIVQP